MSDDREEQIRRLAEDYTAKQTLISLAAWAYAQGARIPDPPAPTLPVVSKEAIHTAQQAWRTAMSADSEKNMMDCLRAAWPIMVRDNFTVLRSFTYPDGTIFQLGRDTIDAIIAALTGQPHG